MTMRSGQFATLDGGSARGISLDDGMVFFGQRVLGTGTNGERFFANGELGVVWDGILYRVDATCDFALDKDGKVSDPNMISDMFAVRTVHNADGSPDEFYFPNDPRWKRINFQYEKVENISQAKAFTLRRGIYSTN